MNVPILKSCPLLYILLERVNFSTFLVKSCVHADSLDRFKLGQKTVEALATVTYRVICITYSQFLHILCIQTQFYFFILYKDKGLIVIGTVSIQLRVTRV